MFGGYLYASSSDVVWRWAWDPATWRGGPIPGSPEAVIRNMDATSPADLGGGSSPNGHVTRTLEFDRLGRLYVSVGSQSNVDNDSFRARIRRFTNLQNAQDLPVDFTTGEVFADGLRNEVGLAWSDPDKTVLYGVENGMDNLYRGDLGGDIHADNPAEELNRFRIDEPGNEYGYPWCWSEYKLESTTPGCGGQGDPVGAAAGRESTSRGRMDGPRRAGIAGRRPLSESGEERAASRQLPGALRTARHRLLRHGLAGHRLRRHGRGLAVRVLGRRVHRLPCECAAAAAAEGAATDARSQGSWNRPTPTGFKVARVPFDRAAQAPVDPAADPEDFVWADPGPKWSTGLRPVDVAFSRAGELFFSSYKTGEILVVRRRPPE